MYYVAKTYKYALPSIVESFDKLEDAVEYASLLTRTGKGNYIVLAQ